ncbi:MAG: hypothetical protein K2X86_12755 [Cytophagaceae bacterium]|nr:hypothetical protein [Cytophagaceae bacterium]
MTFNKEFARKLIELKIRHQEITLRLEALKERNQSLVKRHEEFQKKLRLNFC